MSMIGNFLQLTPTELDALIENPSSVEAFIYPDDEENGNAIDVDKAWHGIHFVLTNEVWEGDSPLADFIFGGIAIGEDAGYGPARYLTPDQVRDVSDAVAEIDASEFCRRFDRQALYENDIYPRIWGDTGETDEELIGYLFTYFESLVKYYHDAAVKGNAMLQFLN